MFKIGKVGTHTVLVKIQKGLKHVLHVQGSVGNRRAEISRLQGLVPGLRIGCKEDARGRVGNISSKRSRGRRADGNHDTPEEHARSKERMHGWRLEVGVESGSAVLEQGLMAEEALHFANQRHQPAFITT